MAVRVIGSGAYIPENIVSSHEVVQRVKFESNGHMKRLNTRLLEMATGIKERRYMDDEMNASDLAVKAIERLVYKTGISLDSVDMLIYASASQDVGEPATAHIVQYKLGMSVSVMDIKNACNSFINGLQVAEALIEAGHHKRIIVCVGESPSRFIRWHINDYEQLKTYMAGYTFGDAGAAFLLEKSDDNRGIFYRKFESKSQYWDIGGVFGGGSMHTRNIEYGYFTGKAGKLREVFDIVGPEMTLEALEKTGMSYDDFSRLLVHQVTMSFLDVFIRKTCMPRHKIEITLPTYGNMAAASMPVAFTLAEERGDIQQGDNVMFAGIAGGISLGLLMMTY